MRLLSSITRGAIAAGLLVALLGNAVRPASVLQYPTPAASQASTQLAAEEQAGIQGQGWGKALCVGCVGLILFGGGSSIWGLLLIAATFPHVIEGCALICVGAFAK